MAGFADKGNGWVMQDEFVLYDWYEYYNAIPKWHTIRTGKRWKAGDMFSPRIWSGKPYASKQVTFSEPIKIEKTFDIKLTGKNWRISDKMIVTDLMENVARNDGLKYNDFLDWFPKDFDGQIICWNERIEYPTPITQ